MSCKSCGSRNLAADDITGDLVCSSCGVVQDFDNFQAHIGGVTGQKGTYIHVGSSGLGSVLNYKDKKIFEANKLIDDLTFKLSLSPTTTVEVKNLISKITDGEFGQGEWFIVLIGACCYVVMRRDGKVLPIVEIEAVTGRDLNEIGRMIMRVIDYVGLKLPEFDIVMLFERMLKNSSHLVKLDGDKLERIRKQGVFLMNCAIKWFLTTGRRPGPIVVAVLVFVAEVNGVVGCRIEDVAKEVHVAVTTCKKRYNEILERLVEVAQVLPWGKDVNVKNIVKNAPSVMNYMELKSIEEKRGSEEERMEVENKNIRFDLEEAVRECLRKDVEYGEEEDSEEKDAQYFEIENRSDFHALEDGGLDKLEISHECLAMIYTKFADEVDSNKRLGERGEFRPRKKRRAFELHKYTDWWNGKSELSKKLLLKKILEKDVGLNALPPSFVKGCRASQRRREKIKAAKCRIDKIMYPSNNVAGVSCTSENVGTGKKRRRRKVSDIDWEDLIIETLLLHKVKEEEIEKGHYKTLLDLHVFKSGVL